MQNFNNAFNNPGMNQFNNNINFNNPWMNQMCSNMLNNNINPFLSAFPNNPMNNLQENFNNFGGNTNQMFNMNNMNQMNMNPMGMIPMNINPMSISMNVVNNPFNNMNNFNASFNNNMNLNMSMDDNQLRKLKSEEINQKMNINGVDSEIQINFRFMNSQSFKVKAKLNEKLKDVINRFENNECPKELKDYLSVCLCQGQKVNDLNKTLLELNVNDDEKILFMSKQTQSENNEKKGEDKEEFIYTEREKEQILKLRLEYEAKNLNNDLKNKLKLNNAEDGNEADDEADIPSFLSFIREKDKQMGINVNEHKHQLVYCLTNISWKCNICNLKYKKEISRYYCSLCDYSMCEGCHYLKKYFMKKSFPKGTKPSNSSVNIHFLDTDYHEHRLVFCRSSRHFRFYNKWYCDNCRGSFENKDWSFYCTLCDFDLCCGCCGFH